MAEQKTIYLIRHGQSLHNALENDWLASSPASDQFPDPMCFDATLSDVGESQASRLRPHVEANLQHIEFVVVSPLTRAIQTCLHAFDSNKVRIHVHAGAREKVENACDLGRPPVELKETFPNLSFEHLETIWWHSEGDITAETYRDTWKSGGRYEEPMELLYQRVEEFKLWLRARPESSIAVVGHSNFFRVFTGMTEKLANCEVKAVVI